MQKKEWFTIPNILSYFRILLIPVFVHMYLSATEPYEFYRAASVLGLSGITDALDGFIARKWNQITEIGKLIDPVADKLTQVAVALTLMARWPYMWILVLLFLVKEGHLLIHNIRLYRRGLKMNGSKWYGKVATIVFYLCMFVLVLFPHLHNVYITLFIFFTAGFQLAALIGYSGLIMQMYRETAK